MQKYCSVFSDIFLIFGKKIDVLVAMPEVQGASFRENRAVAPVAGMPGNKVLVPVW